MRLSHFAMSFPSVVHEIHFGHFFGPYTVHNIDVRLHGLVVAVPSPFHHDVRGNPTGKCIDDEGATAGVGADKFMLLLDLVYSLVPLVSGDAYLLINTGKFAQLFDVAVHRLVGVNRKGRIIF